MDAGAVEFANGDSPATTFHRRRSVAIWAAGVNTTTDPRVARLPQFTHDRSPWDQGWGPPKEGVGTHHTALCDAPQLLANVLFKRHRYIVGARRQANSGRQVLSMARVTQCAANHENSPWRRALSA